MVYIYGIYGMVWYINGALFDYCINIQKYVYIHIYMHIYLFPFLGSEKYFTNAF